MDRDSLVYMAKLAEQAERYDRPFFFFAAAVPICIAAIPILLPLSIYLSVCLLLLFLLSTCLSI